MLKHNNTYVTITRNSTSNDNDNDNKAYTDYYYESAEEMAADLELVKFTRQITHQSLIATPSASRTPYLYEEFLGWLRLGWLK